MEQFTLVEIEDAMNSLRSSGAEIQGMYLSPNQYKALYKDCYGDYPVRMPKRFSRSLQVHGCLVEVDFSIDDDAIEFDITATHRWRRSK